MSSLLHVPVTVRLLPSDIAAVSVNVSDCLIFKRSVGEPIASPVVVVNGVGDVGGSVPSLPLQDTMANTNTMGTTFSHIKTLLPMPR
jgi:hypothetical protein